ncbi:Crp/Fnr family transcriptional regulator [Ferrimonas marina]|uniref:cAMP-binding domain of CRP or a regulatory subunit of cAMP-dependent protein kinases n=1 Tax=Ferrimonas marina TaxID=299255 RepID=A0A1M5X4Y2_9GAMM|nr:Crp/Fnr family transcriptional regulator [Ferrimonas marina]SHH94568.1 cAMP-binding domain of CRP or a regulatory subunit of cAMP-dependent protein kinases [Ferrimonas marina]
MNSEKSAYPSTESVILGLRRGLFRSWREQMSAMGCTQSDIDALLKASRQLHLAEGKTFCGEVDFPGIILIEDGIIAREHVLSDGRAGISYVMMSGNLILAEKAKNFGTSLMHSRCLTPVTVRLLPYELSGPLMAKNLRISHFVYAHANFLAVRIEEAAMLRQLLPKKDFVYLAVLLINDAWTKRGNGAIPFSDDTWCRIVCSTRQYFNGAIRPLVKAGILEKGYRSLKVLDEQRLREMMSCDYFSHYRMRHSTVELEHR